MILRILAIAATLIPALSFAATPRDTYVTQQIYNYNHPFAAQLPAELATKMSKMRAGAFAFYRGTAQLYYKDVPYQATAYLNNATAQIWLEGDAHLQNFGGFRDANGVDVFALNDFDEGYFGPYVWDVWRHAVSILLAAKEVGIASADRDAAVNTFVEAYLDQMTAFKGNDDEKSLRLVSGNTSGVVKDTIQAVSGTTRSAYLDRYSTVSSGQRRFQTTTSLQPVSASVYNAIVAATPSYIASISSGKRYANSYYTIKDIRIRLGSGIGSLGRYRYWLLLEGPGTGTSDDVIVEMKQEVASSVALGNPGAYPSSAYGNHEGRRVATSLKAQLLNADVLAGYTSVGGLPYFLRERSPFQQDFDYTQLTTAGKWATAAGYFGQALASAHALADKDYDATLNPYSEDKEVADLTDTHHAEFRAEVLRIAKDYAQQVEYDYASFSRAYDAGQTLY